VTTLEILTAALNDLCPRVYMQRVAGAPGGMRLTVVSPLHQLYVSEAIPETPAVLANSKELEPALRRALETLAVAIAAKSLTRQAEDNARCQR
jgi:hypothetical protein